MITIVNVALNLGLISARILVLTYTRLKLLFKRFKQSRKIRKQRKKFVELLV